MYIFKTENEKQDIKRGIKKKIKKVSFADEHEWKTYDQGMVGDIFFLEASN